MPAPAQPDLFSGVSRAEVAPLVIRQANARARLVDAIATAGKLDAADAEKVAVFYLKNKVAKLDAANGSFSVSHGRFLDREVIEKCLFECNRPVAFPAPEVPFYERPCASPGWISYRYKGGHGWIMIGAKDHADALNEANRSLSVKNASFDKLEVWSGERYVPVVA